MMAGKAKAKKSKGLAYDIWRSMRSNKVTMVCLIFVLFLIFISLFADVLFDYEADIIAQNIQERLQGPSAAHWFGTDAFGRDYFARIVYATRITMIIAILSTLGGSILGILIGSISAYYGGKVDATIQRILDIIISIPQILLIICVVAVLGGGVRNLIIAFIFSLTPGSSRVVRSAVMVTRENEYVEASRAVGASNLRIIFSHLLPNSLGPLIVEATMAISLCILSTAGLGYLGLGVAAPQPEWGLMLSEAQEFMRTQVYLILFPGLAIVLSAVVFNLLGDGLRDAMDPRLRGYRKRKKKFRFGKRREVARG